MQCDECNEDLVGTYFEKDGKNICEKDYEVGVLSKILDHKSRHVLPYSCRESSIFAESTSGVCSLQKYRKKCSVCGEYIQGSYYTKDDKFICAKDYKVGKLLYFSAPQCHTNILSSL